MAFVSSGFEMVVTLVDHGANETTKTYELTSANYADAIMDAATVFAALQGATPGTTGVTAAVASKYRITETFDNDAFVIPTSADAEVETEASLTTFIDNQGSKKANFRIPAPITATVFQSTVGAGRNQVNIGNAAVIAYHGLFGVGGAAYISDGEVAGVLIKGIRTTKRSRQA